MKVISAWKLNGLLLLFFLPQTDILVGLKKFNWNPYIWSHSQLDYCSA